MSAAQWLVVVVVWCKGAKGVRKTADGAKPRVKMARKDGPRVRGMGNGVLYPTRHSFYFL